MFKKLLAKIPEFQDRNIRLYYLSSYIQESYFTEGVWIFFYLMFFSYSQLGIMDAFAIGIGLLLEIPTGAIADLIGKKKAIQIAYLILVISLSFISFGTSQIFLFIGNILIFAGLSFYSGAADALAYETMVEIKHQENYPKMMAFSRTLKSVGFLIAVLIGSSAAVINPRYPFILWLIVMVIGLISSFWLREPKANTPHFTLASYYKQNYQGFKQLFKPALKPFIVLIFVLLGLDYMYGWGFIKPAVMVSYQMDARMMGLVMSFGYLLSAIAIHFLPRIREKLGDYQGIALLTLLMIITYFLFGFGIIWLGFFLVVFNTLVATYAQSWVVIVINNHVSPEYRATTLSTVAMLLKVPFVILGPIAGGLIESGNLYPFLMLLAAGMLIPTLISLLIFRSHLKA